MRLSIHILGIENARLGLQSDKRKTASEKKRAAETDGGASDQICAVFMPILYAR